MRFLKLPTPSTFHEDDQQQVFTRWCVCMHVCAHTWMHVCMYHICMRMHVCMYAYKNACMYVCKNACMYVCMSVHTHTQTNHIHV